MLNTENYQKKTQILQYENEKKIHIERIPDSDIFWQVNTTKVVYPQKIGKVRDPSLESYMGMPKFLSSIFKQISAKKCNFLHSES